jgi:GT2 family glycosyltransferase
MIDCDIVILTKDRPEFMARLMPQINAQEGVSGVIAVLDNGEDSQTRDLLIPGPDYREHGPFVWTYQKKHISGFANGVNTAIKSSPEFTASTLFLINNDVQLPKPNTLSSMAAHLGHAGVGIAGLRLLQSNGLLNHDGTSFTEGRPFHMGRATDPRLVDDVCALTPATTFACVAIDRKVFDELGGLNEDYKWGSEDVDFCLTAAEHGYRTMTCRKTSAIHDEFGTRKQGGDAYEINYFYGKWAVTGRGMEAMRNLDWPLIDACQVNA